MKSKIVMLGNLSKKTHIESGVRSIKVQLTSEEINYLEESYILHKLTGVMANNKAQI